jgi:hypothetical protein
MVPVVPRLEVLVDRITHGIQPLRGDYVLKRMLPFPDLKVAHRRFARLNPRPKRPNLSGKRTFTTQPL